MEENSKYKKREGNHLESGAAVYYRHDQFR